MGNVAVCFINAEGLGASIIQGRALSDHAASGCEDQYRLEQ